MVEEDVGEHFFVRRVEEHSEGFLPEGGEGFVRGGEDGEGTASGHGFGEFCSYQSCYQTGEAACGSGCFRDIGDRLRWQVEIGHGREVVELAGKVSWADLAFKEVDPHVEAEDVEKWVGVATCEEPVFEDWVVEEDDVVGSAVGEEEPTVLCVPDPAAIFGIEVEFPEPWGAKVIGADFDEVCERARGVLSAHRGCAEKRQRGQS